MEQLLRHEILPSLTSLFTCVPLDLIYSLNKIFLLLNKVLSKGTKHKHISYPSDNEILKVEHQYTSVNAQSVMCDSLQPHGL